MRRVGAFIVAILLAACSSGGRDVSATGPYAPGIAEGGTAVDGLLVGHRLMAAGEHELALDAFRRAAASRGFTTEVLSALGSASLALGRLNQAEDLMRRATSRDDATPEDWNNLGVVLMERGKTAEAEQIFHKAYALDDGASDAIRDNLRLALSKMGDPALVEDAETNDYKLVRRGSSDYLIRRTP